jgi:[acyl-carrier-protein] S-malonyltransferase
MVNLLFPGQGAQAVGMGRSFFDQSQAAQALFKKADEVLGFSISKLIFEGPEEELTKTVNSQPAIYLTSLAVWAALKEQLPTLKITSACGLSLGELTALAALGVFSFEEGLKLVERRGFFMDQTAGKRKGGMVSLVGLPLEKCEEVAKEAGVEVANINSPEQIVLSGEMTKIESAAKIAEAKGAKRALVLKVSGAFHSSLMEDAAKEFKKILTAVPFRAPQGLFLSNVTGDFETDPQKIKENLEKQVTGSVQWVKTMENLTRRSLKQFIEPAPGKVLKGLARRINSEIQVDNLETQGDILRLVDLLKKKEKEAVHAS